jgi:hypothetical protein
VTRLFLAVYFAFSISCLADAELDYRRGMDLARLGRWEEARQAFLAGAEKAPSDKRFPIELAGVAFKQKDYRTAKACLRRALRLDPEDRYANNFLGTIYFLEDNLEAALKFWNRAVKPQVEQIRMEPQPRVDPALLDRAFAFSPASVLTGRDLLATEARLDALGIFPYYRFQLSPGDSEDFDMLFHARERNGWGEGKIDGLVSLLRGVPYQTVYPEFFNLRRSALNFQSMLRWDAQKRRAFASFSGGNPRRRYRIYFDGRNENWTSGLNLEKLEAGIDLTILMNGRWRWSTGIQGSYRRFRNSLLVGGWETKYRTGISHALLRIPEKRMNLEASSSLDLGRSRGAFSRIESGVKWQWLPVKYEVASQFRAGKTLGVVPFDELFILGVERDNDLWLRGHVGTLDGRKGSAPMGRDYALWNSDFDRIAYRGAFFQLQLGPFLDSGHIFGSPKWLWDTGVQAKVRVFNGVSVVFSYGKDLRSGGNAFYATVLR